MILVKYVIPEYRKFEINSVFDYIDMKFDKNVKLLALVIYNVQTLGKARLYFARSSKNFFLELWKSGRQKYTFLSLCMLLLWHLGERFKWQQKHEFQFLSQYEHWFNYHLILYYNDVCLISRWMLFCSKILSGSRWHKSRFDNWCLLRSGYVYWSSCHSLSYNFCQG